MFLDTENGKIVSAIWVATFCVATFDVIHQ